jgi:hypothetical protein
VLHSSFALLLSSECTHIGWVFITRKHRKKERKDVDICMYMYIQMQRFISASLVSFFICFLSLCNQGGQQCLMLCSSFMVDSQACALVMVLPRIISKL